MNLTIKEEEFDATMEYSDNFDDLVTDDSVTEDFCYDNLSDVGSIKIEEHDVKEIIRQKVKIEKEQEDSLKIHRVYCCYNCNFKSYISLIMEYSDNFDNLDITDDSVKEEPCYDDLSDIGSIKIEEHDLEINIKVFKINIKGSHIMTHTGEKPFQCDMCEYKPTFKSNLKLHMMKHTGEKPLQCDVCEYKCTRKSHLQRHILTHTGKKPFQCDMCEYKCTTKSRLKDHIRTHIGEKPFQCDTFKYKCSKKSYLQTHIFTHTGEKPFQCVVCEYKCLTKSNLQKHILTHTSRKPFQCDQCKYKCTRKSYLKLHMRRHSDENPL